MSLLCHVGYFRIGYFVTLDILALANMALVIMTSDIQTCNHLMHLTLSLARVSIPSSLVQLIVCIQK